MNEMTLATLWGGLEAEASRLRQRTLRDLFEADANRFATHSYRLDDLLIDFSKEKLDMGAWAALLRLAHAKGVEARRDAIFAGDPVNETEGRAVFHVALRGGAGPEACAEGEPVMGAVEAELDRFSNLCRSSSHWRLCVHQRQTVH